MRTYIHTDTHKQCQTYRQPLYIHTYIHTRAHAYMRLQGGSKEGLIDCISTSYQCPGQSGYRCFYMNTPTSLTVTKNQGTPVHPCVRQFGMRAHRMCVCVCTWYAQSYVCMCAWMWYACASCMCMCAWMRLEGHNGVHLSCPSSFDVCAILKWVLL
jgi:hypothetical protein